MTGFEVWLYSSLRKNGVVDFGSSSPLADMGKDGYILSTSDGTSAEDGGDYIAFTLALRFGLPVQGDICRNQTGKVYPEQYGIFQIRFRRAVWRFLP